MDNDAKLRPWILAKILYERTDYDNCLTTSQLISILEEEYNMPTHRTTIYGDIEMLRHIGMDIQCTKSTQNKYNVLERYFSDAELRLMIDAVASSRFIPAAQSKRIIDKISAMAGQNGAKRMTRNVSVDRRIKGTNRKVMSIIDAVNEAINLKKQISFQYFLYDEKKARVPRRNGELYRFSPWRLVWNGDFYYMVGWYEKYNDVTCFRIDRIVAAPKVLEDDAIAPPKGFDLDRHINTMYHMFSSDRMKVELLCENQMMDAIIDRFGEGVITVPRDRYYFKAVVEVAVNSVFFAWVVGFEGKVIITGPDNACEEYLKFFRKAYEAVAPQDLYPPVPF